MMYLLSDINSFRREYPTPKSMLSVKPEYSSRIGIHISSVAPGKTVDSNITKSPFLRLLPTTKHALFNGNKSGSCDDVTPVGTHIQKTRKKTAKFG